MAEISASNNEGKLEQTPLEIAMQIARDEVLKHEDDLQGAGIKFTPEQLLAAADLAAERIHKEHLAKESGDPLIMIENTLREVAQTDEEKSWADAGTKNLRKFREDWQKWYRLKQSAAQAKGLPVNLEGEIKSSSRQTGVPSFTDYEPNYPENKLFNPGIASDVLGWRYDEQNAIISIPKDYLDRVVIALCPMLNGLKLGEANTQGVFPLGPKPGGKPYVESGGYDFKNLPGSQKGIALTVYDYGRPRNRLAMSMGVDTLQKIIDFNPSGN